MATQGQAAPAAATAAPTDPVNMIQAILAKESAPPEVKADQTPPPEQQEEEAPVGDNRQVEGGEAPPEIPPAGDKPAMAEIPLDQLEAIELEVTTKGDDGKDVTEKPTIKELREGYMRQKDYSRKTAEVARQREEQGEKVRQAIDSERTQYVQNLQVLQATLLETAAPELKDVNWNQLATNDAFEYVRLRNRADQISQASANIQAKIKEVTDKQAAEQKVATNARAQKARETLESAIPGWNDALYQTLMKAGEPYGYKPEEIGQWLDPRSIQVLHDAYQFRQSKAVQTPPPVTKKVTVPPKVLRPGGAPAANAQTLQKQDAMKRLQGSGRINDAAAVIANMLK